MKNLILALGILLPIMSFASCGSESVTWPVGVDNSCGDQLISNDVIKLADGSYTAFDPSKPNDLPPGAVVVRGAKVGAIYNVTDVPNSSSEAKFKCTESGWKYVSGSCSIEYNYKCISETLKSTVPDFNFSPAEIHHILLGADSSLRDIVVSATNHCR